jgi:hypothetical protein
LQGVTILVSLAKEVPMTTHGKLSLLGPAERAIGVLAACLFVCACSSLPKGEVALDLDMKDRGVASWYGQAFHGKLAANGEVFSYNGDHLIAILAGVLGLPARYYLPRENLSERPPRSGPTVQ